MMINMIMGIRKTLSTTILRSKSSTGPCQVVNSSYVRSATLMTLFRPLFGMKMHAKDFMVGHLPSLEETSPTTLPPIIPPMQKMATTKDQMKVTEVSQAPFRDSHSSRLPLVSCAKKGGVILKIEGR